jgi:prepilin-type N-terminal cleavage/methylation domain-containing protein
VRLTTGKKEFHMDRLIDPNRRRRGFTLIELLVVIAIIAVLIGLLCLRCSRRERAPPQCKNNLSRPPAAHYLDAYTRFPPVSVLPFNQLSEPWSAQARLLPYIDQANLHNLVDWSVSSEFTANPIVCKTRVPIYLCPSEVNDRARPTAALFHYPLNYSFNEGTWFIYDPMTGNVGDGAFHPNKAFRPADMPDGMSNTLCAAENKAFQPNLWDTMNPATLGVAPPANPAAAAAYFGGTFDSNGHTEWVEGDVHECGFTTTFGPNSVVPYTNGGVNYDIDITSMRDSESLTVPTYAAASRSYHEGLVQVLLMDGSARAVSENIDLKVWRSLGTRAGGEVIGEF